MTDEREEKEVDETATTCGGCGRPIVLNTKYDTWNFVEETGWCRVHDPLHYVKDADGGVIGDQSHFPEGSTPTKVNEW